MRPNITKFYYIGWVVTQDMELEYKGLQVSVETNDLQLHADKLLEPLLLSL